MAGHEPRDSQPVSIFGSCHEIKGHEDWSRVEGKTPEGLAAGIIPRRALEGFFYMVVYIVKYLVT